MSEQLVWNTEYLLREAQALAATREEGLASKHFWLVADRDMSGDPPKELLDLKARAENYLAFDLAFIKHSTNKSDPDVAAAVKRIEIFKSNDGRKALAEGRTLDFLRLMCQTNLLFLGREMFNKFFTFYTHAPVCNFFVQKDPSKKIEDQDETKERLLLYPRGTGKSTLDVVDCVQWFINLPSIRILILAAETGLAASFIGELKNYFFIPKGAAPTNFQKLFPEWTIASNTDGVESEFICPKRTVGDEKKKDPSAWAASILSNLPGWHCDLAKVDDAVNDKNAETPQLVAKVIRKVNYAASLVDPGGMTDLLGTPYAGNDLYAFTIEKAEKPEDLRLLSTPARWLKPASMHKDERDCTDADWELLFEFDKTGRKRLTSDFLNKKKRKDLGIYLSQYMLNASGTRKVKFPMDLLVQRTIPLDQLPHQLRYYILWDFAYAANQQSDYSCGAVIGLDSENRMYLVELYRDHYTDSELAREIVASYQKFQPRLVCIENSNGAQFLEQTIRRYSEESGISYIPLDFFKVDRSPNAKASRVGALQPLLVGAQLFFLNSISYLDDLYKEFKDFGTALHDDIPDAISHALRVLPTGVIEPGGPGGKKRQEEFNRMLQEKDFYDMLFGQGDYAPVIVEQPVSPEPGTGGEDLYDPYSISGFGK